MRRKLMPASPSALGKLLCFLFISLFFSTAAMAQTVSGKVTDANNNAVAGVTVTVKGTTRATVTNDAGNFSINASGNDVLVLSAVGFSTQEIPVNRRSDITINLSAGSGQNLDEVVVTALG